ncbi:MAG: SDR family oxidoreductase [bacterium]|nr:SDR family oxidoreductase [bacterium]
MGFLGLENKTVLVFGVANKRSVAYHVGRILEGEGATVIYSVRSPERARSVAKLLEGRKVHICDLADEGQIAALTAAVGEKHPRLAGMVHSVAFANYDEFTGVFHEVGKKDFLQAMDVTCYSLIAIAKAFAGCFEDGASVVTISISTTRMTAESYGYMAPAKAALDSTVAFLAKSFSRSPQVRFNAVGAGLLKTSASAGIPGYVDNYLFAEQATLRKRSLTTEEVANTAAFLLSGRSSGINAQTVVVDAGMGTNYFDADIVKHTVAGVWPTKER